ncbi:MAG: hypothetical protein M3066_11865 [Actinomycetota bacterium]|nr:hypothetical protein [Actinomycetota bacterium]
MKRVLAVLVGAGIAMGGGAAAWAATGGGPNKAAAKACATDAKAKDANISRADLKTAVKDCLTAQGITVKAPKTLTPEQQARRDALRTCLQGVKAANPGADKTALRTAAQPCLQQAGIAPGQIRAKLGSVKDCIQQVLAANPSTTDRATLRGLVKACVQAK